MSDLQKALDRFEQSLPVLDSLDGEVSGTHKDERDNYLMDAWLLVAAARAHLSCPDLTSQIEELRKVYNKPWTKDRLHELDNAVFAVLRAVRRDTE